MLLEFFDTYLGAQGMEIICELQHYLISLLSRRSLFSTLFIIFFDNVEVFLDGIEKLYPSKLYHVVQNILTLWHSHEVGSTLEIENASLKCKYIMHMHYSD